MADADGALPPAAAAAAAEEEFTPTVKYLMVAVYAASLFAVGSGFGARGPALTSLARQVHSNSACSPSLRTISPDSALR